MVRYSMIGAASNAGGELFRLMLNHPETKLMHVADGFAHGQRLLDTFPALNGFNEYDLVIEDVDDASVEKLLSDTDVLFLAVDAGTVSDYAEKALAKGVKVIDFGADMRFRDAKVWEEWYKVKHKNHEMSKNAVYSIPEIWRDKAKNANLIANPGCYPTATTLGLYPLLKTGAVVKDTIIVNTISGTTGAGRRPVFQNLYTEMENNFRAYGVATHRHTPEIEQNIETITGVKHVINFQPHLAPMARGIHATVYCTVNREFTNEELYDIYQAQYKDEPFVRVHPASQLPNTKWTAASNFCDMAATYDPRTHRVIICSVIDNIGKGAAGQAIQNMNIIMGLPETMGIYMPPTAP